MAFSISLCLSRKSVDLFPDMEGKVPLYGNQGANSQFKQSSAGRSLWKSFPSQLKPGKQFRDTEQEHMTQFHILSSHGQIAKDGVPKNRKERCKKCQGGD